MERSTNQTDHNLRRHVVTEAMMVALACRKVCPGLSGSAFSLRILCQSNAWIADEIWEIKAPVAKHFGIRCQELTSVSDLDIAPQAKLGSSWTSMYACSKYECGLKIIHKRIGVRSTMRNTCHR